MRNAIIGLSILAGIATISIPAGANAQEFDAVQGIIKPQINIERVRKLRRLIRDVARDRFIAPKTGASRDRPPAQPSESHSAARLPGSTSVIAENGFLQERFDLEETNSLHAFETRLEEIPSRLSGSFFVDAGTGRLEDTNEMRAYDGTQQSLSVGFDLQLSDRLLIGFIASNAKSDVDNTFVAGNSTTDTISLGGYGAIFLSDTLVLTASVSHNHTRNTADGEGVTAGYDSNGWTATTTLTQYISLGGWQIAPSLGASYDDSRDDAYRDSMGTLYASEVTRSGIVTAGISAGYTFALGDVSTATLNLSAEAEHEFYRSVGTQFADDGNNETFDATLGAELDLAFNEWVSFSLGATMSGLGKEDYRSHMMSGRLTISF